MGLVVATCSGAAFVPACFFTLDVAGVTRVLFERWQHPALQNPCSGSGLYIFSIVERTMQAKAIDKEVGFRK